MKYIKGNNRNQTTFFCLEQAIEKDNEVRLIDLFVDSLSLDEFGFKGNIKKMGDPRIILPFC